MFTQHDTWIISNMIFEAHIESRRNLVVYILQLCIRNFHVGQVCESLLNFHLLNIKRQRALFCCYILICMKFTSNKKIFNVQRNAACASTLNMYCAH